MDNTISAIFKEKNEKILFDKLLLDIDNNFDSLLLTINNKIALSTPKLIKKVNDVLFNYQVDYDLKSLTELLNQEVEKINKMVVGLLDLKKAKLKEAIQKASSFKTSEFDTDIDESTKKFREEFDVSMNKVIYLDLSEAISKNYNLEEEAINDLNTYLNNYDMSVSDAIIDSIEYRDNTLKNITKETYNKYIELNNKTANLNVKKSN